VAKATDIPKAVREEVAERDGYKCRMCGRTNNGFEMHHIVYRSQDRNNHAPDNLICLCYPHHRLAHSKPDLIRPVLQELVEKRWLTGLGILRREKVDIRDLLRGTL
jgi:5-methylcytosine-specific restriction endonuclease McrA